MSIRTIEQYMVNDMDLVDAITKAFYRLYKYDHYLIDHEPEVKIDENEKNKYFSNHHVGERAIVFRYAYYLQEILHNQGFYSDYVLDCEYNRDGDKPKIIMSLGKNVFPDLVIHKRVQKDNLLVMEFKTYWNRNQEEDIRKIEAFMDNNETDSYNYKYGIAALIGKDGVALTLIDKWKQCYIDIKSFK